MLRFIVRRLLVTIPTILVVITITCALVKLAPGNFYSGEKRLSAAIEKNIREKYGLDKPWYQQYGKTVWSIVGHFDFGTSLRFEGQSVNTIIWRSLPVSASIGILAYILALIVGITAGSIAALKQNSKWDYGSMALAMLGISIPNFVLGPILVLIFSIGLYWFPPSRWGGFPSRSLVLPVLTSSAIYMAYIARLTRASMLEVLRDDYVRTAHAKGLRRRAVIFRHVLRNAMLPILTYIGPATAFLITGAFVVENMFNVPGIGRISVDAIGQRDYPVIQGTTILLGLTVVVMNLITDVLYHVFDPRIQLND